MSDIRRDGNKLQQNAGNRWSGIVKEQSLVRNRDRRESWIRSARMEWLSRARVSQSSRIKFVPYRSVKSF
jgi:hypothetical protein